MNATGSLSVLNVGAGDLTLTFNQHDRAERARALKMLTDMQRRGYAILVRLEDGSYVRAKTIDAAAGCYVIQEPEPGAVVDVEVQALATESTELVPTKRRGRPPGRGKYRRVPIERAHGVGIARSAGG
jgi:hypothetical protein